MSRPSADTETAILLCARLGQKIDPAAVPLRPREFAQLHAWLATHHLKPSDLPNADLVALNPPVPPHRLLALLERQDQLTDTLNLWARWGIWVLSQWDTVYPTRLRRLGTLAPPLLCGAGDSALLDDGRPALAVVGSRYADRAALDFARLVASACADAGICVVSGSARGVDSEAMTGATRAGGTATGVLADSLAAAARSSRYQETLRTGKLILVSPYDPQSPFSIGAAMGRNKYIYALADAAIVVSTSHGSGGTWAGAIEALKAGHRVHVWLGNAAPEGNHRLIEEGALQITADHLENLSNWLKAHSS